MTATVNANTTTGVVVTSDTSGALALQTGGTTALTISSAQAISLTNALPIASGGTGSTTLAGANIATTNSSTQSINSANTFGFKNRIINGGMVIDQRNAGASVTPTNAQYTLDRWKSRTNGSSIYTVQQTPSATETGYATRVAAGFTNYLGCTSTSAYSLGTNDTFQQQQSIEGFNITDFAWGTANAKTATISFLVRSSLTGTFSASLISGGNDLWYAFSYSIPTANTWTQISVTISAPTTGTFNSGTNSTGIVVSFNLGIGSGYTGTGSIWSASPILSVTGSTNVVATNGATLYITGVQLEVGTQATSFDFRDYGRELILCQRYYYGYVSGTSKMVGRGGYYSATQVECAIFFPTTMRTMPSLVATSGTNYYSVYRGGGSDDIDSLTLNGEGSAGSVSVYNASQASGTIGYAAVVVTNSASASVAFNSEL